MSPGLLDFIATPSEPSEALAEYAGHASDDGGKSWRELTKAEAETLTAWREAASWPVPEAPRG